MSDFLQRMGEASRARAARTKADDALSSRVASAKPPIALTTPGSGFDVIAEVKPASPTEGRLLGDGSELALATQLAGSGAAALSVLTESTVFAGSLRLLEEVAQCVEVPVMRKDFLVDPVQVIEARAHSASGVLLVARLLERHLLAEMVDAALALGMFALVEVFDARDIEHASLVFDRDVLVGVNARDLTTLVVDPGRHADLAPSLPRHLPWVAESGIGAGVNVGEVVACGYRHALVGSALARSSDPVGLVGSLLETGRSHVVEMLS